MSNEVIAVVRLSRGEVGYYDELSRIHLTISSPQRDILAGTNCTKLRKSVKSGRLKLLSGSLGEDPQLDLFKKGNKFTGIVNQGAAITVAPVVSIAPEPVETPATETIQEVVTPAVEDVKEEVPAVEEAGVVDIAPVQAVEEVPVVEEVVAEKATKTSRKNK